MKLKMEVRIVNLNDIGTQLMYITAPIYAIMSDGRISSGTSFFFSINVTEDTAIPLLITNYHVIENAQQGYVEMHVAENGEPSKTVARVQFDSSVIQPNKLGNLDLVALPLAGALNDLQNKRINLFYKSIDVSLIPKRNVIDDLSAIEDITFIGYPNSIYDTTNKIPVIRQGITATPIWNNFKGQKAFLIDAGVFPGSSGSPVFIYNRGSYPTSDGIAIGSRVLFVGILTETLKRKEAASTDYLDLGVVINSAAFFDEINKYILRMTGKPIPKRDELIT